MARKKFVEKHVAKVKASLKEISFEEPKSEFELSQILNWYWRNDYSNKIQKKWVIEFTKNEELKKVDEKLFIHPFSTVCRLLSRGLEYNDKRKDYVIKNVEKLLSNIVETEVIKENPKEVKIIDQTSKFEAEVDYALDCFIKNREELKLQPVFISNNISKSSTEKIKNHIKTYIDEYETALNGYDSSDEEDKEYAISYGSKIEIKRIIRFLQKLENEASNWILAKTTIRKPRSKKQKTPEQICKNVKMKDSIIPITKIVESTAALVFNKKYGKLHFLVGDVSLNIKGSTVINIDENKSAVFTVKTKERNSFHNSLEEYKSVAKMRKFLEANPSIFKISKSAPNGRLSENTNLIWVD